MKIIYFALLASLSFYSCNNKAKNGEEIPVEDIQNVRSADNPDKPNAFPKIVFAETHHDFGKVYEGEKVAYSFSFKNEGDADLIIHSATGSCGCTVTDPPKEPIKPGDKNEIKATFDSNGRVGKNSKTITVKTNASDELTTLSFDVEVIKK